MRVCNYYDVGVLHGLILNIQTHAPGNKAAAWNYLFHSGLAMYHQRCIGQCF